MVATQVNGFNFLGPMEPQIKVLQGPVLLGVLSAAAPSPAAGPLTLLGWLPGQRRSRRRTRLTSRRTGARAFLRPVGQRWVLVGRNFFLGFLLEALAPEVHFLTSRLRVSTSGARLCLYWWRLRPWGRRAGSPAFWDCRAIDLICNLLQPGLGVRQAITE